MVTTETHPPALGPAPGGVPLDQKFRGVVEAVPQVREFAAAHAPFQQDNAQLCISELATNAIRYSRSGEAGGWIHVTFVSAPGWFRLNLTDQGPSVPGRLPHICDRDQGGDWMAEGRRGLRIVSNFSDAWGIEARAHATTVWAEFRASGP